MKQIYVTSAVLLRFLLNDDTALAPHAATAFQKAEQKDCTLWIDAVTIADTCMSLMEAGFARKEITSVFTRLLLLDGVICDRETVVLQALDIWARSDDTSFADAFALVQSKQSKALFLTEEDLIRVSSII